MAAGMINTNAIQLQFFWNHSPFSVRFNKRTSTIDINPQGIVRNAEGLCVWVGMTGGFVVGRKIENILL